MPPTSTYYNQAADASRANLSLLLPFTGANASTTFTDLSPTPKTVTARGAAKLTTAQQGIAAGSCLNLTAATSDWVEVADHADFAFGSGDFTIEFFIKLRSLPAGGAFMTPLTKRATTAVFAPWNIFLDSTGTMTYLASTSGGAWEVNMGSGAGTFGVSSVFVHVLFCRSGTTFMCGSNNIVSFKQVVAGALMSNASSLSIGANAVTLGGAFVDGWINHLRITKGVCRYSTASLTGGSYVGISNPTAQFGSNIATPDIPWPTT